MKLLRYFLVFILLVITAYFANLAGDWISVRLKMEITPENENVIFGATLLAIFLYAVLTALPFVPGVEIGIGLMVMFGSSIAIPVYLSTVTGLCLGFMLGRLVPESFLLRSFEFLGLTRLSHSFRRIAAKPMAERLESFVGRAPKRFVPFFLRHRYVAVAVAFNIPGSSVIGGGGGISFAAGASRIFSFPAFFLAVAIGVSPVPILVLVFGAVIVG